jgi:hypothetical protein
LPIHCQSHRRAGFPAGRRRPNFRGLGRHRPGRASQGYFQRELTIGQASV